MIGECVHGVQRLLFGDDCHRYHRRRLLSSSFVIIFIVIVITIICHRPSCGSWKLDHAIIFESRPHMVLVSRSWIDLCMSCCRDYITCEDRCRRSRHRFIIRRDRSSLSSSCLMRFSLSSHAVCFWVGRAPRLSPLASANGLLDDMLEP